MNRNFKKDFKYTWEHKKAFLKTEKELLGKNTIKGYLHDVDKLFLYLFFSKKQVSMIHRVYALHHTGNHLTKNDIVQALIDWESSRLTKPDKPETARQYLEKHIPQFTDIYKPVMIELGIW